MKRLLIGAVVCTMTLGQLTGVPVVRASAPLEAAAAPRAAATSAPRALAATARPRSVALTWSAPSKGKVTAYRVQRIAAGSTTWVTVAKKVTARSFTAKKLRNGTAYAFRVIALNKKKAGKPSSVVVATPNALPGAPSGLAAVAGDGSAALTWRAPAKGSVSGYVVERASGSSWSPVITLGVQRSHTVGGLENDSTYRFRVRAINTIGTGSTSNVVAVTLPSRLPGAPTALVATPSADEVSLSWTPPVAGPVSGYVVEQESGATWTTVVALGSQVSYTVRDLERGNTFTFRVRAVNAEGAGPASDPASAVLPTTASLSVGTYHSCAVLPDATGRCWGLNSTFQLGEGTRDERSVPARVTVDGNTFLTDIVEIAPGDGFTCARRTDGTAWCWGFNEDGQLGDGTTDEQRAPGPVVTGVGELGGVASLVAGAYHACALLEDATARCWGDNIDGQLGDGSTADRWDAVTVLQAPGVPLTGITQLSAGGNRTCAVLTDHTARCWGENGNGELGDGTTDDRPFATPVTSDGSAALTGVEHITTGLLHSCALMTDGTARCWGLNIFNQLSNGVGMLGRPTPVMVQSGVGTPLTGIASIDAGRLHTCAVLDSGTARCWGRADSGQLGDGSSTSPTYGVVVSVDGTDPLTGIETIVAGGFHTCARLTNGTLRCWGSSGNGQLGDGSVLTQSALPVRPVGL